MLNALPENEIAQLSSGFEELDLPFKMDLIKPHQPLKYVYFLHRGVASFVSPLEEGMTVEIATVGPEGMIGLPVLTNGTVPYSGLIQVPGEGVRIRADEFRHRLRSCPTLYQMMLRYMLAMMTQMAQNAACNRAHPVDERCARWLLMTHDRVSEHSFPLTQEFLSQMLGVRRPTVSIAASMLARAGLISYVRGQITILDREGLEAASCECYSIIKREFDRLLESSDHGAK